MERALARRERCVRESEVIGDAPEAVPVQVLLDDVSRFREVSVVPDAIEKRDALDVRLAEVELPRHEIEDDRVRTALHLVLHGARKEPVGKLPDVIAAGNGDPRPEDTDRGG